MGHTPSPLRYPGGKIRLANYVKSILITNNLYGGCYVEPYAGGAGIVWRLLFDNYIDKAYINDVSRSISSFWTAIFTQTDEFCKLIEKTPIEIDEWYRQKAIQGKGDASTLELGFSTFFLNRTNRSGIILGGVIGGKQQQGKDNLDARFNKEKLIKKIRRIADYREKVYLFSMDANTFLKNVASSLPQDSLLYLDPPYYKKGADLYEHHYTHNDHVEIEYTLSESNNNWIVSYDNVDEIKSIYSNYRRVEYELNYSASTPSQGEEVIFFSDNLQIPGVDPIS